MPVQESNVSILMGLESWLLTDKYSQTVRATQIMLARGDTQGLRTLYRQRAACSEGQFLPPDSIPFDMNGARPVATIIENGHSMYVLLYRACSILANVASALPANTLMQRDGKKYKSPDGNITWVDQSEYAHELMAYLDNADLINERLEALEQVYQGFR